MSKFISTLNKDFSLTFENGLTISVQFGCGNYCSNNQIGYVNHLKNEITESKTAEIAIWDESNNWYNFGSDSVKGYLTPNEVALWIYRTKNATNIETI